MDLSVSRLISSPSQSTTMFDVTATSLIRHAELMTAASTEAKTRDGCMVLEQEFDPEANPENIITKETKFWISMLSSGLVGLLFILGVPGNIISAAVFYKHGLKERINLCIFCLSLVDLVVITVTFFLSEEEVYRSLIGPSDFFIKHFVGLTGFTWVSMFLSAVIATERCFCVVSPLRAHSRVSTRSLAVIIMPISAIILTGMLVIAGPKHTEACVFDPQTNTTSFIIYVTEYYIENKEILDILDIFLYSMALPVIFFAIIVVTTIVTAAKLQSTIKWRQELSTASQFSVNNMVALTRMLIGTSVLFVVCLFPVLVVQTTMFVVPDLKYGGHYHNLTDALWSVIAMFRCVNSSLNFFIYYKMGSRFRRTLKQLVRCRGSDICQSHSNLVQSSANSGHSKKCVSSISGKDNVAFKP